MIEFNVQVWNHIDFFLYTSYKVVSEGKIFGMFLKVLAFFSLFYPSPGYAIDMCRELIDRKENTILEVEKLYIMW